MRVATAQNARHGLLYLFVGGLWVSIYKRFGRHDNRVQTKATLRRLFIDERLLNGMRLLDCSQAFQGCDVGAHHRLDGRDTGADRTAFYDHCASAALSKPAPELWSSKFKVIAQRVEERSFRIYIEGIAAAVNSEGNCTHISCNLERANADVNGLTIASDLVIGSVGIRSSAHDSAIVFCMCVFFTLSLLRFF